MAKHWIAGATKNSGGLHRALDVPEGKKIPVKRVAAAAKKGGKVGAEARLAQTLGKFQHSPDRYDGESTGEIPRRLEYHSEQETASAKYPSAKGYPDVQQNNPTGSPRATVKTLQSGPQSTPGNRDARPSKVDSYSDDEV